MSARLEIRYIPTADLKPYARNARTHSEAQIAQLAASIQAFGWTNPVLVDEGGGLIAGHGRVQAALALGIDQVPTVCLPGLSEAQKRALVIADNKLALNAGWDVGMLAQELQALDTGEMPLGLTGFGEDELERLLTWAPTFANGLTDPDEVPSITVHPLTKQGDVWCLGRHRLMCADSTSGPGVAMLRQIVGKPIDLVLTDPPYCSGGFQESGKSRGSVGTDATHKQIANDRLSTRGYMVADPFTGSGTTFIACERLGLTACGMELDALYCDVTIKRWQNFTGKTATLESTGEPFQKVNHGERPEAAALASEAG